MASDLTIIAPHPYIRWIHLNPNHDATMRIGSEAPKQRCPFFLPAFKPCRIASNRYLGSFLAIRRYKRRKAKNWCVLILLFSFLIIFPLMLLGVC